MSAREVTELPSLELPKLPLGDAIEWFVRWLIKNLDVIFDFISDVLDAITGAFCSGLLSVLRVLLIVICGLHIW